MTREQVIKLGEKAEYVRDVHWFSAPWWVWILVVVLMVIVVMLFSDDHHLSPFILMCVCGVIFIANTDVTEDDQISRWEKNVATPYVDSLPIERKEIVFIKIDPEMTSKTKGSFLYGSGYIDSRMVEKTPITVSFKDNGIVTRTDWYQTKMELTKSEKPYIEFQRLNRNLGHSFKKGLYNVRIHLPESYKFTEIK